MTVNEKWKRLKQKEARRKLHADKMKEAYLKGKRMGEDLDREYRERLDREDVIPYSLF